VEPSLTVGLLTNFNLIYPEIESFPSKQDEYCLLNFAIQTAREAGHLLAERFGRALQVTNKSELDLVTESDLASERLIIERIKTYHPRHAILAEESGVSATAERDQGSEWRWIIDPLDGTTNYAHGYPCFCVSIGLEHEGKMEVGVIYDPMRDELFTAERGAGASLNGRRIQVSPRTNLSSALLCTGFPYDVRERSEFARHFANFIMNAQGVRRDGAAALDLAYVACGRFDGFWEEGLKPWDVAAGTLMVEEAGGRVSNYAGEPLSIYKPPIVASNGLLHEEMMRVLAA
jgi:myo-inositol-1(or 4)-monophosphatase